MGKLDDLCQRICGDVDGSVAVGVVDLSSGMMMGVYHNVPYFTQEYLDVVSASAVELFRGKLVTRVENLLSKQRGKETANTFKEIFINSDNVLHFMKIIEAKDAVVVMITKKTTNQGMGWSNLKMAVPEIREMLP